MSQTAPHAMPAQLLSVGDWIECDMLHPTPHKMATKLQTPEAVAYGLELLANPESGWRLPTLDWEARQRRREAAAVTVTN